MKDSRQKEYIMYQSIYINFQEIQTNSDKIDEWLNWGGREGEMDRNFKE